MFQNFIVETISHSFTRVILAANVGFKATHGRHGLRHGRHGRPLHYNRSIGTNGLLMIKMEWIAISKYNWAFTIHELRVLSYNVAI